MCVVPHDRGQRKICLESTNNNTTRRTNELPERVDVSAIGSGESVGVTSDADAVADAHTQTRAKRYTEKNENEQGNNDDL
jgi:hypothetical protein